MSNLSGWKLADVSGEAMREWCELLRDDNAIHLDPQAAAALGFGPRTPEAADRLYDALYGSEG